MTTNWRCILLALISLLAFAAPASAEEPKGFQDWPWGTSREALIEPFLRDKCRSSSEYRLYTEHLKDHLKSILTCSFYEIGDVTAGVMLHFEPLESLAGYTLEFKSRYREMRQTILEKLGKPTLVTTHRYKTALGVSTTGEEMTWRWPSGTAAQLSERCPESSGQVSLILSCFQVSTAALQAQSQRKQQEHQEQRKKGF